MNVFVILTHRHTKAHEMSRTNERSSLFVLLGLRLLTYFGHLLFGELKIVGGKSQPTPLNV